MDLLLAMTNLQAGLHVFVMGFIVVFLGMGVIIAVVSLIGKIMEKVNANSAKKKAEQASAASKLEALSSEDTLAEDSEEEARIRAAIVAVLTNYYFNQGSNCEFKIKKIRRI